jgi:hypothetical protein
VHTHRGVTTNKPDIVIRNNKEKTCILTDVAILADRTVTKRSRKETKIQEFMYGDTANVEHKVFDYTHGN